MLTHIRSILSAAEAHRTRIRLHFDRSSPLKWRSYSKLSAASPSSQSSAYQRALRERQGDRLVSFYCQQTVTLHHGAAERWSPGSITGQWSFESHIKGPDCCRVSERVDTFWSDGLFWIELSQGNLGSTSLIKLWETMTFAKRSLQEAAHGTDRSIVPCREWAVTGSHVCLAVLSRVN